MAVDDVEDKKLAALDVMESQFFERGTMGSPEQTAKARANPEQRRKEVRQGFLARDAYVAQKYRDQLAAFYGKEKAAKVQHAEAFEITEYGSRPNAKEIKRLFPFYE